MTRSVISVLRQLGKRIYWRVICSVARKPRFPSAVSSVLFVCKGNICRSPFASEVARKWARENNVINVRVESGGLEVSSRVSPPPEAVRAAEELSVSIAGHLSQALTAMHPRDFDIVVVMEVTQRIRMIKEWKCSRDRVFVLTNFDDLVSHLQEPYDVCNIRDPYGKDQDVFLDCYLRIERCVHQMFQRIV